MSHRSAGQFATLRAEPAHALDRFFGRERELGELRELVDRVRLLTLVGPAGVGKSRLALELVQRTSPAAGRAAYVDLSLATSATELLDALAPALGVDQPATTRELAEAIGADELVLLLDNCPHLAAAGAELTVALLGRCPNLCIVATSHERLGVPGEAVWQVPPLTLPAPGADLAASEARALLVERMSENAPHFRVDDSNSDAIDTICRRVDGLPLALELAASWLPALTPGEVAERLVHPLSFLDRGRRGAPARHQSMRAAIQCITGLLSDTEALLLRRLAIFAGPWDLEAARAVVGDDALPAELVLSTLANLAGKSLVQVLTRAGQPTAHYRLLNVVRDYAREQLDVSGERHTISERHAAWYAQRLDPSVAADDEGEHFLWLRREQANVRAALNWAIESENSEQAVRFAAELHRVWYTQGRSSESRTWLSRVLAMPSATPGQRASVASWVILDVLAVGDFAAAESLRDIVRELAADVDTPSLHALALDGWAAILLERGEYEQAENVLREQAWLTATDLPSQLPAMQLRLATINLERGDLIAAEQACAGALTSLDHFTNQWVRLRVERLLGRIAFQRAEVELAVGRFEAVLGRMRELGDRQGTILSLLDLARALQARRHLARARQLVRDALLLARQLREPLVKARVLETAAGLLASARPEGSLKLAAAAAHVRERLGVRALPLERAYTERTLHVARTRLSPGASGIAAASGEGLVTERALSLALELLDSLEGLSGNGIAVPDELLTPRERVVAALIQQGLTNRAIAQSLVISEGTVRAHVEHILNKLGVRSRTEIAQRLRVEAEPRVPPE